MGYSRTGGTGERLSKIRLMLIVVAAIVLFILGFLIGFFAVRNDSESETRRSIEEIRKDDMEKKSEYHTKLYKGLDKTEIGKNLKYVSLYRLTLYMRTRRAERADQELLYIEKKRSASSVFRIR